MCPGVELYRCIQEREVTYEQWLVWGSQGGLPGGGNRIDLGLKTSHNLYWQGLEEQESLGESWLEEVQRLNNLFPDGVISSSIWPE